MFYFCYRSQERSTGILHIINRGGSQEHIGLWQKKVDIKIFFQHQVLDL